MYKKVLMLASPPNQELLPPKADYNVFLPGAYDNGRVIGYSVGVEGIAPKIGKMEPSVLYYTTASFGTANRPIFGKPDRPQTLHYMIAVDGRIVCGTAEYFIPNGYRVFGVVMTAVNAAGQEEGSWRYFKDVWVEAGNKFSLPGTEPNGVGDGKETLSEYMRAKASGGICVYLRIEVFLRA